MGGGGEGWGRGAWGWGGGGGMAEGQGKRALGTHIQCVSLECSQTLQRKIHKKVEKTAVHPLYPK